MTALFAQTSFQDVLRQYLSLTKPRVNMLISFCALIGMLLASDSWVGWPLVFGAIGGISLLAAAGFVLNCLIEREIDARMARTRWRPSARGEVSNHQAVGFALALGLSGALLLWQWVNVLTMWLTIATFVGYAIVYTVWLKPATPQNIVIGGASGAMPPVLGWAAVTNELTAPAWILFLIIFVWTPPHFWALALYRLEDYRRSGLPMLPVTHGSLFTRLNILLYSVLLAAVALFPYLMGMSGWLYLIASLMLNAWFVFLAWRLYRVYSDTLAKRLFRYSIWYLAYLFAALLIDHYLRLFWLPGPI
ncbi:MAG: protoheme IX farnesyltransferase [Betaproteobacteria bacterium]|nr:protoheme IX farnesyltransferase [Betaproteobacteria bacterium]